MVQVAQLSNRGCGQFYLKLAQTAFHPAQIASQNHQAAPKFHQSADLSIYFHLLSSPLIVRFLLQILFLVHLKTCRSKVGFSHLQILYKLQIP